MNRCDVCLWKATAELAAGVDVGRHPSEMPPAAYVATGSDGSQWFECEQHLEEETKGHTGAARMGLQRLDEWNERAHRARLRIEGKDHADRVAPRAADLGDVWSRVAEAERMLGRCEIALRVVRKFLDQPTAEAAATARIVIDALDD